MAEIMTVGETMAVFSPESREALRYVPGYRVCVGGAESNVAVGLAKLGVDSAWFSRLGKDEFGALIKNRLRSEGVDCSAVLSDPIHRTGVMFKELGVGETRVFYYRENSAASHLCPADLREDLLDGVKIVHLSGITPVLSDSCREMTLELIRLAERKGVKVSFDPNIRRKLWKDTDFSPLIRSVTLASQIVLMGLDEAEVLFGIRDADAIADRLFGEGKAEYIALKDGANGAWVADRSTRQSIPPYPCKPVDPVGAGDGFNAGFLAGLLQGKDVVTAGKMGAVCGALATQSTGDTEGYPDADRLDAAMNGNEVIYR